MPNKNENLPVDATNEMTEGGSITYANEVIAIISGIAASEIEGIAGMVISGGFGDIIGKNRNITRGVKVEVGTEEVSVDLYAIVEYGQPIQRVASEVQENVRKSIEAMTGLKVVRVDVHVQGVSFEKDKREVQSNLEAVNVPNLMGNSRKKPAKAAKEEKAAEAVKEEKAAEAAKAEEQKAEEPAKAAEPKAGDADHQKAEEAAADAPAEKPDKDSAPEAVKPERPAEEPAKPAAKKPAAKPARKTRKA